MRKKIIIVGNTQGLIGVKVDVENYKRFFCSSYGGNWYEQEIIEKVDVSKSELLAELSRVKSLTLDYLIVIFSGHGGQERETVLEINAAGECIRESELKGLASRQLNIFDCCRAYPERLVESETKALKTRLYSAISTRERYEKRIMEASRQQISLYACSIGEFAHDTQRGGAYSVNLIERAAKVEGHYKLVGDAHKEAGVLTSAQYPEQHPDADLLRLTQSQQLIIGIKP